MARLTCERRTDFVVCIYIYIYMSYIMVLWPKERPISQIHKVVPVKRHRILRLGKRSRWRRSPWGPNGIDRLRARMRMCVYMYISWYMYVYVHIYIYIYIQ